MQRLVGTLARNGLLRLRSKSQHIRVAGNSATGWVATGP